MSLRNVKGTVNLRRTLQGFAKKDSEITKGVKRALEDGANVIFADTLKNVPKDQGDLARALHKAKRSSGFAWRVGWWKKGNLKNWRLAGWRAHFTEFGTKGKRAQPSLGPAWRKNVKWIVGQVKKEVKIAFKKGKKL